MAKCNARTAKGTLCGNGLGCPHHREHCAERIRARARAREIPPAPPVQGNLFERKLTWQEVLALIEQGRREERASQPGNCGCQG